jgi:TPR repeat protein
MERGIKKVLAVAVISGFLGACATYAPPNYQDSEFLRAKADFNAHNYKKAYIERQGPASNGNPEAQYALGYMYYYGKGVVENHGRAIDWFTKAAAQGQPDAQKALDLIHKKKM